MSPLDTLANVFALALNGTRQISLSCPRCLSQVVASEQDGRVRFTCSGGCTEDEAIGALAEVEPKFGEWWLNGGLTDEDEQQQVQGDLRGTCVANVEGVPEPPSARSGPTSARSDQDSNSVTAEGHGNRSPEALERPESHDSDEHGGLTDDGRRIEGTVQETAQPSGDQRHHLGADNHRVMDDSDAEPLETQMPRQGERPDEASVLDEENENDSEDSEPHLSGQVEELHPDLQSWKMVLYAMAQTQCDKAIKENRLLESDLAAFDEEAWAVTVGRLRHNPKAWQTNNPEGLSESEIEEELQTVAVALRDHYAPTVKSSSMPVERPIFICQDVNQATQTNALYLARPEVVEKLGYSQSIALCIGGKHHGKTTNIRTLALSVGRGVPIWGRQVTRGPVLYVASDDELASTRYELIHMGWREDDQVHLANVDPHGECEPSQFIEGIAQLALQKGAIMIVLDMLFDFVLIKDELGYVDTRKGLQPVQTLADETKAWVVGSHHTPKYLTDAHNAANAALGSQGVSARFSPIILTRKWTEGLYTVESTLTRDPRGEMIKPTKIVKNTDGWIETAGEFKEYMKWEIYAQRILDLFDDSGRGYSVFTIAEKLGLDRSRVQNTVKELEHAGQLKREKRGRAYRYYLGSSDMFQRENGNWRGDA